MVIYKTTNLVNGKIYIGKDVTDNDSYLGSGLLIKLAIKKYGRNSFKKEILERCSDVDDLSKKEKFWIQTLKSNNRKIGYNITDGGTGGVTWWNSPKRKENFCKLQEGSLRFNQSEDGRKFLSENSKKMWQSKTHQNLIRQKMLGREITWKKKISQSIKEWHKTNPISDATRKRISKINSQKMTGMEFKIISDEIKDMILKLYNNYGPKTISSELRKNGVNVSVFLIKRILKKEGIYQKGKRGLKL